MSTDVAGDCRRRIPDAISAFPHACAKVDVFKPHWREAFVKATYIEPRLSAEHQKCAGGLLGGARGHWVLSNASVLPVNRVVWEKSIDTKNFEAKCGWRRQVSDHETRLRLSRGVGQKTPYNSGFRAGCFEGFGHRDEV
jgi:hypothetical protein